MKQYLLTLLAGLLLGVSAQAQGINYYFYGTATGTLGEIPFEDAPFSFQITADQQDISPGGGFGTLSVSGLASVFEIQNVAVDVFSGDMILYAFSDQVVLARPDGGNILSVTDESLVGYDLRELAAPVFSPASNTYGQFVDVATGAGPLTFTSASNVTFSTSPVPEPSAALLGLAAAGTLLQRRRRTVTA